MSNPNMTADQQQLFLIRGCVASMPEDQQARVKAVAEDIRKACAADKDLGVIALALVGAEMAAA